MAFRNDITDGHTVLASRSADARAATRERYLFGPVIDFVCLGGASLIVLPVIFVLPLEGYKPSIAQALVLLSFVINYPHFAHSYQIFYRRFAHKAFGRDYSVNLRIRYIIAGIVVPVAMTAFFAFSVSTGDARLLGYSANAMFLLVGWHYVKQGYGILMVDAVLKRQFFSEPEKRVLRFNGYMVWFLAWLLGNSAVHQQQLLEMQYYTFAAPAFALQLAVAGALVTGALTVWTLVRRAEANGGTLPYNGIFAYIASLYFWILVFGVDFDPIWLLAVPGLHSLQYLIVVWRYQLGYEKDRPVTTETAAAAPGSRHGGNRYRLNLAIFVALGMILGALGFWFIPLFLQNIVPFDAEIFGARMFMFIFFIFINVHHYFLDNVMWRRENPDIQRYLFS